MKIYKISLIGIIIVVVFLSFEIVVLFSRANELAERINETLRVIITLQENIKSLNVK